MGDIFGRDAGSTIQMGFGMPTVGIIKEGEDGLSVQIPVIPNQVYVGIRPADPDNKALMVLEPYYMANGGQAIPIGPAADQPGVARMHIGHFFGHIIGITPEEYAAMYAEGAKINEEQEAEWQRMRDAAAALPKGFAQPELSADGGSRSYTEDTGHAD